MSRMSAPTDADALRLSLAKGDEWSRRDGSAYFGWNDRRFRDAVATLRQQGYPVVSTSGEGSVYRLARSREELEAFVEREIVSRSRELEEQARALRDAADKYFGTPQLALAI